MTNEFDMSTIKIPYGVLHDAKLKGVSEADNRMIFSFDFDLSPEDYEPEFYERYAGFKHCDMIVEMTDEPWNYFFSPNLPERPREVPWAEPRQGRVR